MSQVPVRTTGTTAAGRPWGRRRGEGGGRLDRGEPGGGRQGEEQGGGGGGRGEGDWIGMGRRGRAQGKEVRARGGNDEAFLTSSGGRGRAGGFLLVRRTIGAAGGMDR